MERPERLTRLRLILGDDGLDALSDATVMVLGLGGVGASCAEALARGGVGSLILLDGDVVEESNINRQALAFTSTVGRVKSDVMRDMVAEINPDCVVFSQQVFITRDNLASTLDAHPRPDYVIDCIDTITQKLGIAEWCAQREIRLLSAMGAANKLDPCQLEFADVHATRGCPLSTAMRKQCRHRGIENLEVLYSPEPSARVQRNGARTKGETLGSMSYMPPIMGQMLAGMVIRRLAGMVPFPAPPRIAPAETQRTEQPQP